MIGAHAVISDKFASAETELTPADWGEIRQEAIAQVKARRHRQ